MRNSIQPPDMRRIRAQRLTGSIMQELSPLLDRSQDDFLRRDVHEAVFNLLWRTGVEIITDFDRKELGLPDRGNEGWTPDELRIMEAKRIEALLSPMPPMLMTK